METNYSNFKKFDLKKELLSALIFRGYKKPTFIQSKSIPIILQGQNAIISSKTGSGKTLSYLIPLISMMDKHSQVVGSRLLILLPTRELAIQTCSVLKRILSSMKHSIENKDDILTYSLLVGGHNYQGQFEELAKNPDILIATPGRIIELASQINLSLLKINYLVIDEADLMFQLGFKPQIKMISEKLFNVKQMVFVSATIPEELNDFASVKNVSEFKIISPEEESKIPKKLQLHYFINNTEQKLSALIHILSNYIKNKTCIVFVHSRHVIEYISTFMEYKGYNFDLNISFIHGNMDMELRNERLALFKNQKNNILIVTDLIARGIDIPDVEYVINYDTPQTFKTFIHRCGRTARIEKNGCCINLLNKGDEAFIYESSHKLKKNICQENLDMTNLLDENLSRETIYSGVIPYEILLKLDQDLENIKPHLDDFNSLERTYLNSYKRFNKLQEKPSQRSILIAKKEPILNFHSIFLKDKLKNNSNLHSMLDNIKNYRSKESYLYKKILTDDQKEHVDFLNDKKSNINNLKDIKVDINNNLKKIKTKKEFNFDNKNLKDWRTDFKNQKFYLNEDEDSEKISKMLLEEDLKENQDVVFLTENNNDSMFMRKKIWDSKKKKYKQYDVDLEGNIMDEKRILKMKKLKNQNGKLKGIYNMWKQNTNMQIQRTGEEENKDIVNNAKNSFRNRKQNKFKINNFSNQNKIDPKGRRIKKEMKNSNELLKMKKNKLKAKLKNMPKNDRKNIMNKIKKK